MSVILIMRWGLHFLPLDLCGSIASMEVILSDTFQGRVLTGKTASAWLLGMSMLGTQAPSQKDYTEGIPGDSSNQGPS